MPRVAFGVHPSGIDGLTADERGIATLHHFLGSWRSEGLLDNVKDILRPLLPWLCVAPPRAATPRPRGLSSSSRRIESTSMTLRWWRSLGRSRGGGLRRRLEEEEEDVGGGTVGGIQRECMCSMRKQR